MKIYYRLAGTAEWHEIYDLYWFEENFVHDLAGEDDFGRRYDFLFKVDGVPVWSSSNAVNNGGI